jgi:hypothetical protein
MTPQFHRFAVEELLDGIYFAPTYGNTLMGLAASVPLRPEDHFSISYYAPQPRAVLRVVDPQNPSELKPYGGWGRVELTTLTKEFFMPRFLERDEAIRREPRPPYAWDGVAEVRPSAPWRNRSSRACTEGRAGCRILAELVAAPLTPVPLTQAYVRHSSPQRPRLFFYGCLTTVVLFILCAGPLFGRG